MIIEPWDFWAVFGQPPLGVRKDFEPLKGSPAYKYFCIYIYIHLFVVTLYPTLHLLRCMDTWRKWDQPGTSPNRSFPCPQYSREKLQADRPIFVRVAQPLTRWFPQPDGKTIWGFLKIGDPPSHHWFHYHGLMTWMIWGSPVDIMGKKHEKTRGFWGFCRFSLNPTHWIEPKSRWRSLKGPQRDETFGFRHKDGVAVASRH